MPYEAKARRIHPVRQRRAVYLGAILALWWMVGANLEENGNFRAETLTPAPASPLPGSIRGRDGAEMVLVPAGEFWMGSLEGEGENDEHPWHQVYLDAFYIDKHEVTNTRYRKCVDAGKCTSLHYLQWYKDPQRADHPVASVDWEQARAYCGWAGRRLPTEPEWEKAARGTDGRVYPWGSDFGSGHANIIEDLGSLIEDLSLGRKKGYGGTAPVGSFPSGASPYGALDMAGNVYEWVADWYDEGYYARSPSRNPKGPESGEFRLLRGGSEGRTRDDARAAHRHWYPPNYRRLDHGFRCAQDFTSQRGSIQTPAKKPPAPTSTPPGQIQRRDGAEMVLVPAGEFWMGSPEGEGEDDEHPRHRVYLDVFYIDKHEVTNARYRKCVEAGRCTLPGGRQWYNDSQRADHSVVTVNWEQARAYCGWAGRRLPTEAEWEKAARGTDGRTYPWGSDFGSGHANRAGSEDGYVDTAPVGSFPSGASPYGALDMAGNVWEWVADWYDEDYYARSPSRNPKGPESGYGRVLRGGSWSNDLTDRFRCAARHDLLPLILITIDIGFRCAQDFTSPGGSIQTPAKKPPAPIAFEREGTLVRGVVTLRNGATVQFDRAATYFDFSGDYLEFTDDTAAMDNTKAPAVEVKFTDIQRITFGDEKTDKKNFHFSGEKPGEQDQVIECAWIKLQLVTWGNDTIDLLVKTKGSYPCGITTNPLCVKKGPVKRQIPMETIKEIIFERRIGK